MVSRERKITDRYAKKMHAHIKWITVCHPWNLSSFGNAISCGIAFSSDD
ncbi:hypothetical protein V1291_002595 [Nitrobacteraceae bacterium AZCC 1564]